MSEKYFIKCDTCGEKIYLGQPIYKYRGYCGCYCSGKCFAAAYADSDILTLDEVENSNCELYKEEEITTTKITKLDEADVLMLKILK
jgi:hypothetical protein